jgi:hypothetical protein
MQQECMTFVNLNVKELHSNRVFQDIMRVLLVSIQIGTKISEVSEFSKAQTSQFESDKTQISKILDELKQRFINFFKSFTVSSFDFRDE